LKAIATLRLARHWVAGISVTAVVLGSFAAQPTQKTKPAKSRPAATKQSSVGKPTPQRQNELKREQRELQAELAQNLIHGLQIHLDNKKSHEQS